MAVVHDRRSFSTPIIYINGVEQSIAPRAAGNPALPFIPYGSRATIGNRATSDRGFNGLIDDFRVYGALLTSGEIVQIMEEGARPKYAVYPTGNQAPEVEFMPVADAQRGKPLPLNAVITDDGLLLGVVNVRWRKLSGAGAVTFSAPCQAESQALFSNSGSYVLELSVEDGEKTTVRNLYVNVKDTGSIVIIK